MKSLLILTLVLNVGYAVADDYNGDPNMEIARNPVAVTEGFANPPGFVASLKATGKECPYNCPSNQEPTPTPLPVEPKTTLYLEKGVVVSETGPAVESSSGAPQNSNASQLKRFY